MPRTPRNSKFIKCPFASVERLQKLTNPVTMPEIQSLAIFYSKLVTQDESGEEVLPVETQTLDEKQTAFFARILTHADAKLPTVEENEAALRNFFAENSGYLTAGFDTENLPFGIWAAILTNLGVNVSDNLLPRLQKALSNFVGLSQWQQMSPQLKNKQVDYAIIKFCAESTPTPFNEKLASLNKSAQGITIKAEMMTVLNTDIEPTAKNYFERFDSRRRSGTCFQFGYDEEHRYDSREYQQRGG